MDEQRLLELIAGSQTVSAIKLLHELTGYSLGDSTRVVEHMYTSAEGLRAGGLEVQLSRLTIVGGVRERSVVTRRGRGKTVCARGAYWALLCSPLTSPLDASEATSS